ncbi:MAG TPA: energy transducer TonB [Pararhizobium sp.]|nr:energy transducer TonB [Pararhizobium sp.]
MSFSPDILPPEAMLLSAVRDSDELAEGGECAPEVGADADDHAAAVPVRTGRVALTVLLSITFHLAVAAFFLVGPAGAVISRMLAGTQATGLAAAGNAEANQTAGSASAPEEKPVSVTLVAPPRRPQPKQPSPTKAPKPQKLVTQDEHPAHQPPPQEILTAKAPGSRNAAQPVAAEPPPPPPKPEAAATAPTAVPVPAPRPAPPKPVETAQSAPALPGGKANARYGVAGGTAAGHATSTESGRSKTGSGNAAVSNYPGEISRKLNRSLRYPERAAAQRIRGETQVQFTIDASGKVGEVHVVTTSGSDILDQAAIETVKRAAPFPPIPSAADRHEWPFTVTLAFGK